MNVTTTPPKTSHPAVQKAYKSNAFLQTVNVVNWKGTPVDERGRFVNLYHPYLPNWIEVLKWQLQTNPFKAEKKKEVWRPPVSTDHQWLQETDDVIVWLGHSTYYVRLGGIRILTDPVLDDILSAKRKSRLPFGKHLLTNVDFILLSHDHRDHLDEQSLKLLTAQNPNVRYLTGLGMKDIVSRFTKSTHIQEAGWYQQYKTNEHDLAITFIPSRHWSTRGLSDTNTRLWGGFVIEASGKRILFGGDSGYDQHYQQIASVFKSFDYAILGIGAYEPAWFMKANHQSPDDALRAFSELNARYFIPMHYGTFDLSDEPLSRPLQELRKMASLRHLTDQLKVVDIGQPLLI